MQKTIILHIGAHKTGTTAIQSFFAANRETFAANGLLYPAAGIPSGSAGHHCVPWAFGRGRRHTAAVVDSFQALKKEIRASVADTVLLSSEELERQNCPTGRIARDLELGAGKCIIVLFVRRQDELIASAYAEQVKQGRHFPALSDFVDAQLKLRRGDYHALLMSWRRVLPKVIFRILNYSDPAVAADSVKAMCDALQLAVPSGLTAADRRNPSIHPRYLPFLNFINRAAIDDRESRHNMVIRPLLQLSSAKTPDPVKHYVIDPALRARIVDCYAESNALLGQESPGKQKPFSFDRSEFDQGVCVDPDGISLAEFARTFRAVGEVADQLASIRKAGTGRAEAASTHDEAA
jgi:hypothetical protein